jgi:hypothetical protein
MMRIEAAGTLAQAQGRIEESLKLMRSAASLEDATEKHPVVPGPIVPARELLAGVLLESNQPTLAWTEFERLLTQSPDRLSGLYGAACAAKLAGNREKAENYYGKLSRACSVSDGGERCFRRKPQLRSPTTLARSKLWRFLRATSTTPQNVCTSA